jgi:hypothetical protein
VQLVENEVLDSAVLVLSTYQTRLYENSDTCLKAILKSFWSSNRFMEQKLYLIQKFQTFFFYRHADEFLQFWEQKILEDPRDSFMSYNINPVKICVLVIDIVIKTQKSFKVTQLRCLKIREELEIAAENVIKSFQSSDELKLVLK